MKTIEYRHREEERQGWGPGPWDHEPDKVQWQDEETGLPCLVVRGPMGAWCGYVGVDESHPLYGKGYDEVEGIKDQDDNYVVAVHGGLTFAAPCGKSEKDHGVCHLPEPGEPDNVWWFGFDCGHFMDVIPRLAQYEREIPEMAALAKERAEKGDDWLPTTSYKPIEYVKEETQRLAQQLKVLA